MANTQNETNISNGLPYSGWRNFETWAVAYWIEYEENVVDSHWHSEVRHAMATMANTERVKRGRCSARAAALGKLAFRMRELYTKDKYDETGSLGSFIAQEVFKRVDWFKLAEHFSRRWFA